MINPGTLRVRRPPRLDSITSALGSWKVLVPGIRGVWTVAGQQRIVGPANRPAGIEGRGLDESGNVELRRKRRGSRRRCRGGSLGNGQQRHCQGQRTATKKPDEF